MTNTKHFKEVVAVSGGFDPVTIGHIRYFKEASKLGRVIAILNSDKFLVRKKGYVFMPQKERKEILESIKYIDEVFLSIDKDQTVIESLRKIKPEIFAKGGDRNKRNIPERAICKELSIRIVDGVGGDKIQSSSELVKKAAEKL